MKRYLGMSEQEISENEEMFAEERGDIESAPAAVATPRAPGISPGAINTEIDALGGEGGALGAEAGPNTAGMSEPGGGGAAGAIGATPSV